MAWEIVFHEEFDPEFEALPEEVQDELYAQAEWIERLGPEAGRPHIDTLKGSRFTNMKELRFNVADGVWRVAFAFDPSIRGERRSFSSPATSQVGAREGSTTG